MSLDFAVVDVETANESFSSICSIGVAKYRNSTLVAEHYTLINPNTYFSNTDIHGITRQDVQNAPSTFDGLKLLDQWLAEFHGRVVCHMPFDKTATHKAAEKVGLDWGHIIWHDSAKAVKLGWPEYRQSGYGLKKIAKVLGISFDHHNALEDAKAAGQVLIAANTRIDQSKTSLWEQISLSNPIRLQRLADRIKSDKPTADADGEYFGQGICFTGTLPNMTRKEAATIAAALGFEVLGDVNKKCNLLVTGELDESQLVEDETKSSKWRKAEDLISSGVEIRILSPRDFEALFQ